MPSTTNQHDAVPALSDEQFAKLVELLTPGYELSTLMLAQVKAQAAAAAAAQKEPSPTQLDQPAAGSA